MKMFDPALARERQEQAETVRWPGARGTGPSSRLT